MKTPEIETLSNNWKQVINARQLPNDLSHIVEDTSRNIAFLIDFDRTLTYNFVDGSERASLISVLRKMKMLTPEYEFAAYVLYDFFQPIEVDPLLDRETKSQAMDRWWDAHLKLLSDKMLYSELFDLVGDQTIQNRLYNPEYQYPPHDQSWWQAQKKNHNTIPAGLTRGHLGEVVDSGHIVMRDGYEKFVNECQKYNLPIIIFSANGLGADSIQIYLEKHALLTDNTFIVSNQFHWDKNGKVTGYDPRVIHTFNKEISILKRFPEIQSQIEEIHQLIVIGDSLGDAHMSDGVDIHDITKIGLLTKIAPSDQDIAAYKQAFDIVLVGDGDMTTITELIFGKKI